MNHRAYGEKIARAAGLQPGRGLEEAADTMGKHLRAAEQEIEADMKARVEKAERQLKQLWLAEIQRDVEIGEAEWKLHHPFLRMLANPFESAAVGIRRIHERIGADE